MRIVLSNDQVGSVNQRLVNAGHGEMGSALDGNLYYARV